MVRLWKILYRISGTNPVGPSTVFQAGFFLLPPRIWKSLEGGLLSSFGKEGKSVIMLTEAAK